MPARVVDLIFFTSDLFAGNLYLILFVRQIGAGGFVIIFCFFVPYIVGIYGDRFGFGLWDNDGSFGFSDEILLSA